MCTNTLTRLKHLPKFLICHEKLKLWHFFLGGGCWEVSRAAQASLDLCLSCPSLSPRTVEVHYHRKPIDLRPENINYSNHLKGVIVNYEQIRKIFMVKQKYETNIKYDTIRRHTRFIKQTKTKQTKRQNWNQDFTQSCLLFSKCSITLFYLLFFLVFSPPCLSFPFFLSLSFWGFSFVLF